MRLNRRNLDARLKNAVTGSVVMVTGASSGIGEASAQALAAAGATVLLVARSKKRLVEIEHDINAAGGSARAMPADLTDSDDVARLVDEVHRSYGHVDILVSNAGRSIRRSIELSYDRFHDFERTIDVNYLAPVHLVLGLLPDMREHGRGHIINVSSLGVLFRAPRFSAYLGSKSAFDTFLRCVAPEVQGDGVAVTNIYLSLVRTPMIEPTRVYQFLPQLTSERAAQRVCLAIVERPSTVTPALARLGTLVWDIAPGVFEKLLVLMYRNTTDSAAARGVDEAGIEAPRFRGVLKLIGRVSNRGRSPDVPGD
jgi:short-subunit dehydrogenase